MTKCWITAVAIAALANIALFSPAQADNSSCTALRTACQSAGFSKGGSPGHALVKDCVNPLLKGNKAPGTGPVALPTVSAVDIKACAASQGGSGNSLTAQTMAANTVAAGPGPVAALPLPAGQKAGPNIVVILVDDFSLDLMATENGAFDQSMPNLVQMQKEGVTFSHYFVTDSLCCPSRSSIFTGLLPHNTGVFTNDPPSGGYDGFMAHGDDAKTFALALHKEFYATGMMGKYLNGYQPDQNGVPQGWSAWDVAGNGYPNFNYVLNADGSLITSPLHLTDELSELGQAFLKNSAKGPFLLEIATFSPHGPYVPPDRYKNSFSDITYPRTPAYATRADDTAPDWLKQIPELKPVEISNMENAYLNRLRSDKGIDDMIGAVRKTLKDLGLADSTYIVFTSDNGYHMGEYSLRPGKQTPFDTDIHVPLIVVGPGIAAGRTLDEMTMNIDFYPTFAELAGLAPSPTVDGHSLVAALHGTPGPWRDLTLVEHVHSAPNPTNPDLPASKSGDPPTYAALRLRDAMYVEYLDGSGVIGYYDLKADPYELHNIGGTLSADKKKALHEALAANQACKGQTACWAAQSLTP